jgi:hypothetical protein
LDSKLNDEFYIKIMILNPSNKALYASFKITLKRWIKSIAPKGIVVKSIRFNTHHMYDMVKLFHVIDKMEFTPFLQDDTTNIFVVIPTTHTIKEVPIVWKGLN